MIFRWRQLRQAREARGLLRPLAAAAAGPWGDEAALAALLERLTGAGGMLKEELVSVGHVRRRSHSTASYRIVGGRRGGREGEEVLLCERMQQPASDEGGGGSRAE